MDWTTERRRPFEIPTPGLFLAPQLAEVVAVNDPLELGRVQVRLLGYDGVQGQDGPVWARVGVPFAGDVYGAFFLPDVGEEVIVAFLNGEARLPVVLGSLWNGRAAPPESLPGDRVDRWTLVGKAGTRIAIVEESAGSETVEISTPGGAICTITDEGGGKVEITAGGSTVTIDSTGITLDAASTVFVDAARVNVSAAMVTVDAPMTRCSGVVQCETLIATTVTATTYTIGAGNVW
jgi:uncharacterized protein involved in type VI secretion and phage assembly